MTFGELLNDYIRRLDCTGKELAESSGLSPSVISRYRSGERIPDAAGHQLSMLAQGLAALAAAAGDEALSAEAVLSSLTGTLTASEFDYGRLADNLNRLIAAADINMNRLARAMNYDASYLSRVRAGHRRPANPEEFTDAVCRSVAAGCTSETEKAAIAGLIGQPVSELEDPHSYFCALRAWLCEAPAEKPDSVDRFLTKLDEFDLNDYIRSIRFDELKVPSMPFQLATSKNYIGLEQMRAGELDFFKATVLSHAAEPVFMCSDMDMADMAEDVEFGKKWMFALAMCLKKGLHLNIIHTIDRPFDEMMLGLESWMPIYMTGQLSPYYLKNARSGVYQHLNYVSGAAALTGECIVGHHRRGKYYLTKKPDEIAYCREKSEFILSKALPLMEIFRSERAGLYKKLLDADAALIGRRHGILSAPPIYTLPPALLESILRHNAVSESEKTQIAEYVCRMRRAMDELTVTQRVFDEMPRLTRGEFEEYPVYLSLEGLFFEKDIVYSYEEYIAHLDATAAYAAEHANYTVQFALRRAFRRMQIYIHEGQFVLISKGRAPTVHFVVRQERLREALEHLILPVVEE